MSETTFGALLGKLIYSKRKAMGLTQMQLAEDAYNTSGKTRRISELESGKVANPHPKTIDPIIVALGISDAEIEECAKTATTKVDPTLSAAYSEAERLLNHLAEQFEAKLPDASLEELGQFLTSKAEEYFALKLKIEAIESTEDQVIELKREAMNALSDGNYQAVDDILKQAEEALLSSQTLAQIAKQVELRILRGDNAFLAGEMTECFKLFKSAALFYEAFDSLAMVSTLGLMDAVEQPKGDVEVYAYFSSPHGIDNDPDADEKARRRQVLYKIAGRYARAFANVAAEPAEAGLNDLELGQYRNEVEHAISIRDAVRLHSGEAGILIEEIAQFLGHSDSRITASVYARYSPEHLRKAANALEFG